MNAPAAIEVRGLTKDFKSGRRGIKLRALDALSLRVEAGSIFGLLGANGSGKSTLLKIALGLLAPTAGTCEVLGRPAGSSEARQSMGYLPEAPYFYRYLTGRELVTFHGRLGGLGRRNVADRVSEVIQWVGLSGAADRRVGSYSKGMLQRIGLAQALVHDPSLVILDEPTAGVDPGGVIQMGELILRLKAEGKTVIVTSHLLEQIAEICDRIAILDHGRLVREARTADLLQHPSDHQALIVRALTPVALHELRAWLAARGSALVGVERPSARWEAGVTCAGIAEAP